MLNCHEHDAQVQADGPALDVVEIILDALAQRGSAAPAVNLGPAGHPTGDGMAKVVVGNGLPEFGDEAGPFWPGSDECHVAPDDVHKLGELVDIGVSEPVADS